MRLAIVALVAACSSTPTGVVATLEEAVAKVDRMPGADAAWQPARKGDTFVIGSAVRTGADSTAKLRMGKTGKLDVKPSSTVYFRRTPGRERDDVKVETGGVEIEAGDESVGLGEAVLEPHGRARVDNTPTGTTIVVTLGRVVLEDNVVGAGESITLSGVGAVAPKPPDDHAAKATPGITIAITGKPARAKLKTGERELAIGEHTLEIGTLVDTPAGAAATIAHGGATGSTDGPSAIRVGEGALVELDAGTVSLVATTGDAVAKVPGGSVTAHPGGAATATIDGKVTQVTAQRGDVVLETATGSMTIARGESVTVTSAGAIERMPAPPADTVVTIDAGESPTVHDAGAPSPIRVRFGAACPASGVVEIAKDRSWKRMVARSGGSDAANVLVGAGTHAYRVRCPGGKGASGTLRVVKDAGRSPLPKAAPRTRVDLDGREYTILYQNLLPQLALAFRDGQAGRLGGSYTFVVKSNLVEKRFASATPTVNIPSGELREGTYRAWVERDGKQRSETGRIVIEFDNAAPSVSIDAIEAEGASLRVRGTAIEGTTVSANNAAVELDRHRRFTIDLATGAHEIGAAVRIAHPKSGVHYYVVRKP